MKKDTVTIAEAMTILNVKSRQNVTILISGGKVKAEQDKEERKTWRIEKQSLLEYKRKRDMRKELLK